MVRLIQRDRKQSCDKVENVQKGWFIKCFFSLPLRIPITGLFPVRICELRAGVVGAQKFWIRNMGENKVSECLKALMAKLQKLLRRKKSA